MTMDGLNLFAASREIAWLAGGKIEKIHQPEKDELVLAVRAGGNHYRLLLSANPSHARAQLTGSKRANPLDAPASGGLRISKALQGVYAAARQTSRQALSCGHDLNTISVCHDLSATATKTQALRRKVPIFSAVF